MSENQQLTEIYNDLKDIKRVLIGDEYEEEGLIGRVKENSHHVNRLEKKNVIERVDTIQKEQEKEKKWRWGLTGGFSIIIILLRFWDQIKNALS